MNHWNTMQTFPPLKHVIFTHNLTSVNYQGIPITTLGLPRGVLLQSVYGLNENVPYFTTHILSLGEVSDDSGAPAISIGLSPPGIKKEGAWNHAEGAILLHSNGRIVHYKGSNLLSWRSIRIDHMISPGDEVTVKWIPQNENMGSITFEINGHTVFDDISDIPSGLLPTMHIQQKGTRTNTTFANLKGNPTITTEDTVDESDYGSSKATGLVLVIEDNSCSSVDKQ